eukprot:Plantae.Rhodophyta-Palmaria_palmata.ctg1726.p1 GENE.Plantae.Rhodophyta-Palmaria_palmata.ctg1726~~Plantae.Rhodophyta-Palmaria_palmata.ctg1726.p1  ORF type:complete len:112 (-),score=25.98 Plantae.Rhodophyta-Palmaria_palmata.ctg1726:415-750(-)
MSGEDVKPSMNSSNDDKGAAGGPDVKPAGDAINLKVRDADGGTVQFKCKGTTPLEKLMKAFCSKQGLQFGAVKFLFDGNRIQPQQTPGDLDMEDLDVIDAQMEQQGGLSSL